MNENHTEKEDTNVVVSPTTAPTSSMTADDHIVHGSGAVVTSESEFNDNDNEKDAINDTPADVAASADVNDYDDDRNQVQQQLEYQHGQQGVVQQSLLLPQPQQQQQQRPYVTIFDITSSENPNIRNSASSFNNCTNTPYTDTNTITPVTTASTSMRASNECIDILANGNYSDMIDTTSSLMPTIGGDDTNVINIGTSTNSGGASAGAGTSISGGIFQSFRRVSIGVASRMSYNGSVNSDRCDDDDDDDRGSGSSAGNTPSENHGKHPKSRMTTAQRRISAMRSQIASREDKAVRKLKLLYIGLLVLTAVVASVLVFQYLHRDELDEFHVQFDYLSNQVIDKLHFNARMKMDAINSLALHVQAYALNTNQLWPFITIPYFEQHVAAMKSITDAYGVQLFPIVTNETRSQWEEYSVNHTQWINASYETQQVLFGRPNDRPIYNTTWFDALWGPQYDVENRPDFETAQGMARQIFTTVHLDNSSNKSPYIDPDPIGPYFPQWQAAPMSWYYQTTVNSNYANFDDFYNCTAISIQHNSACLGIAWTDFNAPGFITTMLYPILNRFMQHDDTNTTTNTTTTTTTTFNDTDNDVQEVVAFLGVDIYWESYLKNILPPSAKMIYVVVQSTCDQIFSFELSGSETKFLNENDSHETKELYNKMARTTRFGESLYEYNIRNSTSTTTLQSNLYIGQSLFDGFCQYDFTIYPSSELEREYRTNKPMKYTVTVAFIIFFTIIVFIGYDCLVERRQALVVRSAALSDSIVSSLFPNNVKQRLYKERQDIEQQIDVQERQRLRMQRLSKGSTGGHKITSLKTKSQQHHDDRHESKHHQKHRTHLPALLSNFSPRHKRDTSSSEFNDNSTTFEAFNDCSGNAGKDNMDKSKNINGGNHCRPNSNNNNIDGSHTHEEPSCTNDDTNHHGQGATTVSPSEAIAELYPDATVLFADIVGFTKWSASRQPADVFILLETIYSSYDKIATRRKVFKIETIGDCYVAVTGCPEPQPDHALIMTRFAHEMLQTLQELLKTTIAPKLGQESLELAMRVGLNSGPVIAGVLRGDRARFQLFGDTMNTAARMESNGQRNCIHVSEATANLLIAKGKKRWLTIRKDMIEAKGKGKMQTYWVDIDKKSRRTSRVARNRNRYADENEQSAWSMIASSKQLDIAEVVDEDSSDLGPPAVWSENDDSCHLEIEAGSEDFTDVSKAKLTGIQEKVLTEDSDDNCN